MSRREDKPDGFAQIAQVIRDVADLRRRVLVLQSTPVTGVVSLASGTATVSMPGILAGALVMITSNSASIAGTLRFAITAGTGFSIFSTSGSDSGVVAYAVYPPPTS